MGSPASSTAYVFPRPNTRPTLHLVTGCQGPGAGLPGSAIASCHWQGLTFITVGSDHQADVAPATPLPPATA